ncbi:2-dehydro-3-deoxygalactonokinase [Loktanella sp. DJP18]|uniref:2-dehydro-3-deoxygalactonokinase n=1 Tax=Loktanella sp. DJP18 TaxID=3409788 RepID=UPI003BB6F2A1
MSAAAATWIAADWGTTHLRVWAMSSSGSVLAAATSDDGMGSLTRDGYAAALDRLTAGWPRVPVIACGMVGSRQGWAEAAYATVPCRPLADNLTPAGDRTHIIPGLKQTDPADVMRGEETQIAGFLSLNPGWDGVICLPGTHTKWVHVSADEVVSFQTVMTGDLFAAITGHTVLRHSTGAGWDDAGFLQGIDDAISRPERLAARLFSLRAEGLLNALPDAVARARLSGLLIGAELAATKPYWLGQQIAVIGAGTLALLYVTALGAQSAPATQVNADRATLAGLTAAWRRWKDKT